MRKTKQSTRLLQLGIIAGIGSACAVGAQSASHTAKTADIARAREQFIQKVRALPQYVSLETITKIRNQRLALGESDPVLQPLLEGRTLPPSMPALPGAEPYILADAKKAVTLAGNTDASADKRILLAQAFPRPISPAPVPGQPTIPRWVRYPLEFQLCGIGLGTHAVDKDQYNRIDRYGLFAIHGNPTAVVVPAAGGGGVTVQQQPPEVAAFFAGSQGGGLPDWASAITVQLDNNHVEWLYRRNTYSMGFVVDRLGFVDAIVVAGTFSPIARTQMEDPLHKIQLGDDTRKVLYRYGYPDTIETYLINAVASASTQTTGADAGAGGGAAAGAPGAPGGGAAPAAGGGGGGGGNATGPTNGAFRTFEFRYEQSYNVVFTIKNNRVVRIYIFGDPDFFNDARRQQLRNGY